MVKLANIGSNVSNVILLRSIRH